MTVFVMLFVMLCWMKTSFTVAKVDGGLIFIFNIFRCQHNSINDSRFQCLWVAGFSVDCNDKMLTLLLSYGYSCDRLAPVSVCTVRKHHC